MAFSSIRNLKKNLRIIKLAEDEGTLGIDLALKLALLECAGWIEVNMHELLFYYLDRKVADYDLREELKKSIKNKNHSISYGGFHEKLIALLGEIQTHKIERHLEGCDDNLFNFSHFKHILNEIKKERNAYAHTYFNGISSSKKFGFTEMESRITYINQGLRRFKGFIKRRCD